MNIIERKELCDKILSMLKNVNISVKIEMNSLPGFSADDFVRKLMEKTQERWEREQISGGKTAVLQFMELTRNDFIQSYVDEFPALSGYETLLHIVVNLIIDKTSVMISYDDTITAANCNDQDLNQKTVMDQLINPGDLS